MKQPFKLREWMAILLALFMAGSCTDDDLHSDRMETTRANDTGRFTITEAKQAFEIYYAHACESHGCHDTHDCGSHCTHGGPETRAGDLSGEDFTPLWDNAVARHQESSSFMTVPIATHKLLRIADIRNGNEHPQRLAVVTEEMHFIKDHVNNKVVPTMKTIIPLDGSEGTLLGSGSENTLCIYRLLSGEVLNYQLIRNGREVFHTYVGEEQDSYEAKMREIDLALDGLTLITTEVYMFGGENENIVIICGYCGGSHPSTTICEVVVTSCPVCYTRYNPRNGHYCPGSTTTCGRCGATYRPSQGHSCPVPLYCNNCRQSYTGHHTCPGPSASYCSVCKKSYVGSHTCTGPPPQVCNTCKKSYTGSHTCPGIYCAVCGTAPCKSKCPTCGANHCTADHNGGNPVLIDNPKFQKALDKIVEILKGTPLIDAFLIYHEKNEISFVPDKSRRRVVEMEISIKPGTYSFKFFYLPSAFNKATELSATTICMHELYHIYTTHINGRLADPNDPSAQNNRDHLNMVNDPNYVTWLKTVIPGHTDDFYNDLKYSGTKSSPVFQNLSQERRDELNNFFDDNKLYNQ